MIYDRQNYSANFSRSFLCEHTSTVNHTNNMELQFFGSGIIWLALNKYLSQKNTVRLKRSYHLYYTRYMPINIAFGILVFQTESFLPFPTLKRHRLIGTK